jgi:CTP:molybdopterin cytidylyltransferase MocA
VTALARLPQRRTLASLRLYSLVYLATPYTKYRAGIEQAAIEAARLSGRLITAGIKIYSPIAHSHAIALASKIDPLDHELWMAADAPFMHAAQALLVAEMTGWQESAGIAKEIFQKLGKPFYFIDPETLEVK